jgi:nitrogen-specific signal transduction histidine kinase/CheY-like chemotaxis protein
VLVCLFIILTVRRTRAFYAEVERREMLEQGIRQTQRIEAVGQLTGGIAHDFNNLLTVILGNLQMAIRRLPAGKERSLLENAQRGASRAAELTRRLLAFSRNQALDPKRVDLNRLVSDMSDMLQRTLGEGIAIETVLAPDVRDIEVDVTELESAILNLAVNARDAMPKGGKLTIETATVTIDERFFEEGGGARPGPYVMLAISDTGGGMPKEVVEKAFDPFFTTKPPGAGTGLGLSQVYGFVKQSGGQTRISSQVGKGTTVTIYLPRPRTEPAHRMGEVPTEQLPHGRGERILVTEDDDGVRTYVSQTLLELGYEVIQAPDGETALRILSREAVDLLLSDIVMPGMNGRTLGEHARTAKPDLKVLFMTGYSRNAIVSDGRIEPDVAMIQKPFSQSALAQRVRQVLDSGEVFKSSGP